MKELLDSAMPNAWEIKLRTVFKCRCEVEPKITGEDF